MCPAYRNDVVRYSELSAVSNLLAVLLGRTVRRLEAKLGAGTLGHTIFRI